jgi:DNA-binding beta-propeller fold protein YncE
LVLLGAYFITAYAQTNSIQNIAVPPTASNFTYPQSLFVDSYSGHIWVTDFSNNRVLRFDVSTLTTIDETQTSSSPTDYFLGQNYPNPFNSSTQIMFSNNSTGVLLLEVYNMLGQKILTLFNQVANANTMYSVTFDAKNLPSGIYLYSIRSATGIEVKKMCLLK